MKSVTKRNRRKSQREAARLKRQAEPDPAMEEDEEVEVHFNQAENTPDTPRVSRSNTPDPEDTIQGETHYAVVIELVNKISWPPSTWTMLTFGLLVMLYADNAIVRA